MKKFLSFLLLFPTLISPAFAVDWTPVFTSWNQGDWGDTIRNLHYINGKSDVVETTKNAKLVLTKNAKKGIYPNTKMPYRLDMLPATIKYLNKDVTVATIPLKNATLYGLSISKINLNFYCKECSYMGASVDFNPMSDIQYKQLKKINFHKDIDSEFCENSQARFEKLNGKVSLTLDIDC